MNILVTGGTGFIGRKLVPELVKEGHNITVLSREDQFLKPPREIFGVDKNVAIVVGDLRSRRMIREVLREGFDGVIHMAARTPVRLSWSESYDFFEVNFLGTVNLVREMLERPSPRPWLLYYSTAEVIPGFEMTEDDEPNPSSPYAYSKYAAELYVKTHYENWTIVRPCNTFDRSFLADVEEARGYFVEKAILQTIEYVKGARKKIVFDGLPDRVRSWMHVSDHVKAIKILLRKSIGDGEIYHIAPLNSSASCQTIFDYIKRIAGLVDVNVEWGASPRPFDPPEITLSGRKFMELARGDWMPMSLYEGLKEAYRNWLKQYEAVEERSLERFF
ncbi:MAG: NAD(P)-dependent oxidoreductase [Candidatus Nezhaarchaeales archaeon]